MAFLKHTKVYKGACEYKNLDPSNINDPYFLKKDLLRGELGSTGCVSGSVHSLGSKYHQLNCAVTYEGQIVALADEIAQRVSDFDDAVRAGLDKSTKDFSGISDRHLREQIDSAVRSFSQHFIAEDVFCDTMRNILISQVTCKVCTKKYLTKQCVCFTDKGKNANNVLEKFVKKLIDDSDISKADEKAKNIIRYLFRACYDDLSIMDAGAFKNAYNDVSQKIIKVFLNKRHDQKLEVEMPVLDNVKSIEKIEFLKAILDFCKGASLDKIKTYDVTKCQKFYLDELASSEKRVFTGKEIKKLRNDLHAIILFDIACYIADMSDDFVIEEYNKLTGVTV